MQEMYNESAKCKEDNNCIYDLLGKRKTKNMMRSYKDLAIFAAVISSKS